LFIYCTTVLLCIICYTSISAGTKASTEV